VSAPSHSGERMDARALAHSRREALRRRAQRIRRSVAGLAVTLFAVAFLIVYVQLASGHDPALVAAARRRAELAAKRSTAGASSTSTGSSTNTGSSGSGAESLSGTESAGTSSGSEAQASGASSGTSSSESSSSGSSSSGSEETGPSAVTTSQS